MSNGKKKNTILTLTVILGLAIIIAGGAIFYLSASNLDIFNYETTRNGVTLQSTFYDQNGHEIKSGVSQTAVNGVPGLFYMSMKIKTTNTGDVPLTSVRLQESHTAELTQALQGATALQPSLAVGQSNIVQWDSANSCTTDLQCGTSEKCVNTVCLMDISNFVGEKTFGATILADYLNAQGATSQISTLVNLAFTFEQDQVTFRTNALGGSYNSGGIEVVVDGDGDTTLDNYIRLNHGLKSYVPSNFLGWSVDDRLVFKCNTPDVCVSDAPALNKDSTQNIGATEFSVGGTLTTTTVPSEPYRSQNCGGVTPCQERYSIAVAPPTQTCGNNLIEGTELCDGTALGGNTCTNIGGGFDGGTLACGGSCTSWDTAQCTSPAGGNVKFRTLDQSYSTGGIAYTNTCGNNLVKYGHETGMSHSAYECENNVNFLSGSQCSSNADCLIMTGLPFSGDFGSGSTLSGTDYRLYQDDSDPNEVWVCVNDIDGDGSWTARFDSGSSTVVSTAPASADPEFEVAC